MQTVKVTDNVEFAYQDSGAPPNADVYSTLIIIHGHTYHSGVFGRMLASAAAKGYRLILPNRRLYPGSTPYTAEEVKSFEASNSTEGLVDALSKQGEYLLLFVDKLIQEQKLQNVTIASWSLGTSFMNAVVAAINTVDSDTRTRVAKHVTNLVYWDPPATCHGIEEPPTGGWIPLYDESIPLDQRQLAFANWLAQYFPHTDLDKKDCHKLVYKVDQPIKPASFSNVPFEEILKLVDFSAGPAADNQVADVHFQPVHKILCTKAFFDPATRDAWGNAKFVLLYGEETCWTILWAAWKLEEESKKTGPPITFKAMPGVNHFGMFDKPELSASTFLSFI